MFGLISKKMGRQALAHSFAEKVRYTPDLPILQRHKLQPLFVYDEMMVGHPKHDLVRDAQRVAHSSFSVSSFTMLKKNAGADSFPLPFRAIKAESIGEVPPSFLRTPIAKVRGELYLVPSERFAELDSYKLNTIYYKRTQIRVVIPYSEYANLVPGVNLNDDVAQSFAKRQIAVLSKAWMYIARPKFWDNYINAFDFSPVRTYNLTIPTNIGETYHFDERHYNT